MWFLVIRPQQKEQEKRRKLIDSLEKHAKVYTVGGLVGIIYSIDKERGRVVLKVDDSNNTKIEFLLDAIVAPIVDETKTDAKK
jgi:preprotein translocase subunit YajC